MREVSAGSAAPAETPVGLWLVTPSREIPLLPGDNIVGRDPMARVWLDSPTVSRRHACVRVEQDRVTLEDLGSKNGTRVRNQSVAGATPIADGDELRFGSVRMTFRTWAVEPTRSEAAAS